MTEITDTGKLTKEQIQEQLEKERKRRADEKLAAREAKQEAWENLYRSVEASFYEIIQESDTWRMTCAKNIYEQIPEKNSRLATDEERGKVAGLVCLLNPKNSTHAASLKRILRGMSSKEARSETIDYIHEVVSSFEPRKRAKEGIAHFYKKILPDLHETIDEPLEKPSEECDNSALDKNQRMADFMLQMDAVLKRVNAGNQKSVNQKKALEFNETFHELRTDLDLSFDGDDLFFQAKAAAKIAYMLPKNVPLVNQAANFVELLASDNISKKQEHEQSFGSVKMEIQDMLSRTAPSAVFYETLGAYQFLVA